MTSLMQETAARLLGLTVNPDDLAAYDTGLDDLIRLARQVFADLGPDYGRERLTRNLLAGGADGKTASLLAAALLRLTDWRDAR